MVDTTSSGASSAIAHAQSNRSGKPRRSRSRVLYAGLPRNSDGDAYTVGMRLCIGSVAIPTTMVDEVKCFKLDYCAQRSWLKPLIGDNNTVLAEIMACIKVLRGKPNRHFRRSTVDQVPISPLAEIEYCGHTMQVSTSTRCVYIEATQPNLEFIITRLRIANPVDTANTTQFAAESTDEGGDAADAPIPIGGVQVQMAADDNTSDDGNTNNTSDEKEGENEDDGEGVGPPTDICKISKEQRLLMYENQISYYPSRASLVVKFPDERKNVSSAVARKK